MGRRRKTDPEQTAILDPDGEPVTATPGDPDAVHLRDDLPAARSIDRLSVPLTSDGLADVSGMRPATREKLKRLVGDKGLAQELGLVDESALAPTIFSEEDVGYLYDAIGSLEAWGFQFLLKIPSRVSTQIFSYTTEEKRMLAPATATVLAKHASGWMVQYKDECLLALLLLSIHRAKVEAALNWKRQDAQKVKAAETEPVKPNGQDAHLGALEQ